MAWIALTQIFKNAQLAWLPLGIRAAPVSRLDLGPAANDVLFEQIDGSVSAPPIVAKAARVRCESNRISALSRVAPVR